MQFADLKFEPLYDGVQVMVPIADHQLSIVKHKMSYGGKMGLYEIAVFGHYLLVGPEGFEPPTTPL